MFLKGIGPSAHTCALSRFYVDLIGGTEMIVDEKEDLSL